MASERTIEKLDDEESKSESDSTVERVATAGAWPPLALVRASTSLAEATAEAVSRRVVVGGMQLVVSRARGVWRKREEN